MKISNNNIERIFNIDNKFYTSKIINKLSNTEINNLSNKEFEIKYLDGEVLSSLDFDFNIVENKNNILTVEFENKISKILIKYISRENVIAKEVNITYSVKSINYIDLELLEFDDNKDIFYNQKQENIKEMANFNGYYVELGQPVYAKSLFLGTEFPMAENRVFENKYFSRYFLGEEVEYPKQIWHSIVGASKTKEKKDIQKYFFDYIMSIAIPTKFRKQYNSWYDHMKNIDEKIILDSFDRIYNGFEDNGVHLDAYVVDDGWNDYESFWEFNDKFPNGLSKIKDLVNTFNSNMGLWIGPRGGYGGTEKIMSDWLEKNSQLKLGSKNKISNDVNVSDFNYLANLRKIMLKHQRDFDISYWKIDGWLLKPDREDGSGQYKMHIMTRVYEYLIKILTDLRNDRKGKDCFINLTSYVNPSPWFLKWVNSLWIQLSEDVGFTENAGNDINRMITYRDGQYNKFIGDRDIRLPLWCLYNHEPIYATTANSGYMDHIMSCTPEEFYEYLMFISTRGNAFWEFHYSYTMFDEKRWQYNAKAIKWIEKNYSILKYSKFIGGNPNNFDIYGYHCIDEKNNKEILSLRNPSNEEKIINLKNINFEDYNKIIGDFEVVNNFEIKLKPYTILILQKN